MTYSEMAASLHELAKECEEAHQELVLPQDNVSLAQAADKLKAAFPSSTTQLCLEIWNHKRGPEVNWSCWNGDKHFTSSKLSMALGACLAAKAAQDAEQAARPVETAQELVAAATAQEPMPF